MVPCPRVRAPPEEADLAHRPESEVSQARAPESGVPGGPQLTLRAIALGVLLGGLAGLSTLYLGLKTGLAFGAITTASVAGWSLCSLALRVGLTRRRMHVLEAISMATIASAAGYSAGALLASVVSAYIMLVGHHIPALQLSGWLLSVTMLGIVMAMLLRRPLLAVERLAFPTGTAAAEVLRGLSAEDGAGWRARALGLALAVGAALELFTSGTAAMGALPGLAALKAWSLPQHLPTPAMVERLPCLSALVAYTWSIKLSGALLATGVLIGWRMCWSLMLGALLCYGALAPMGVEAGFIAAVDYGAIVAWSVWPGVSLMILGGLTQLALRWRAVMLALRSLKPPPRGAGEPAAAEPRRAGLPWVGCAAAAICVCVALQSRWFGVPIAVGLVSVALSLLLAAIAARVAGETDIVATGPLGKVAQWTCSSLLPGAAGPAVISASASAGAANACTGLLTDFKAGQLLGADPHRQLLAHLIGALVGVAVLVPLFMLVLVPDPRVLGTAAWPVPAAQAWRSIAALLGHEAAAVEPTALVAAAIAVPVAVGLTVLGHLRPGLRWVPHPTGLGLGLLLPASQSVTFCVGGAAALCLARYRPAFHARYTLLVAGGLIAGESLLGVAVALLHARG